MNEGLFTAYRSLPAFEALLTHANTTGSLAVTGLAEGERAFLAAALAHRTGRPVVLLSPTELTAGKQAQDLSRLFGEGFALMPPRELLFSRAAASQESTWQRLGTLFALAQNQVRVLCLPIEALMDRCLPAEVFRQSIFSLAEGKDFPPEKLMAGLLHAGYERVAMVEGRGQCAMRGSILDVFPPNLPEALRIEFFDTQVDSIRSFDCISQRSTGRMKAAQIAPASEGLLADPQAAARRLEQALQEPLASPQADPRGIPGSKARSAGSQGPAETGGTASAGEWDQLPSLETFLAQLDALEEAPQGGTPAAGSAAPGKPEADTFQEDASDPTPSSSALTRQRHQDDVAHVRAGYPLRNGSMWMNVLCQETASLLSYLESPILLCQQPEQYPARAQARLDAFAEEFAEAQRRGDAAPAQQGLLLSYADVLAAFESHPRLALGELTRGLGQMGAQGAVEFPSDPVMPYQSRLEPLCKDIASWRDAGCAIVLLTGGENRGKRLQKALADLGTPSVYADSLDQNLIAGETILLPVAYSKGFLNPRAKLCVISDSDLYGTAYQRARKRQKAGERIASFTDLTPGDYVVHDFHGVGLYQGIVQVSGDDAKRDYLLIHFAGNDKLYVPTDQFDRVQKFIGAEHSPPKLNRLGGAEWQRQKSKVKAGLKTLAFDLAELYAKRRQLSGYAFSADTPWQREFEDVFPYELTADQEQSVADIEVDMESARNMDRLLCGDVGYGKTEVALRAAFKAVIEGKQVALLAPTTILVQQHFHTIKKRFAGFPVTVEMLSRFRSPKEQKEILAGVKAGKIDLIVGTHRLLAKDVAFKDLGLLIVDEEHRFGVSHKESIKHMKTRVDVLTLSATPIPRTLHMSMAGIRDMSLLETPPEERLPVKTYVLEYDDGILREAIRRELARGGQVYFLYNRVRSIEQMYARLKTLVPEARIGIAHGQMKESALEDVMLDFYAGAYDILLCTTIIESGLDVPEANTLIVFDADRFGLSQLYQIRGRVGRSNKQAYAYFTTRQNKLLSETAEKRLSAIREFTEFGAGYRIAMRDLEIRGAGDVLGPQQHGHLSAVGYDMYLKLLEQAVGEVQGIREQPELDTRIELSVDAYLPEDYISQELLRIEIYKRIAMIDSAQAYLDIQDELIDRFGDVPPAVENLMQIARLRAITRRLGGSHLALRPDGLHLKLDETYMPEAMKLFEALRDTDPRLAFGGKKILELILKQPGLSPQEALSLAVPVFEKLLEKVGNGTAGGNEGAEGSGENVGG
ncbi:MAG: transcription-repair coupling factor [Candidatus Limiplasma sp.]|nr:transcription-repair coupling factor [Candidatus Limiplasma sp.]